MAKIIERMPFFVLPNKKISIVRFRVTNSGYGTGKEFWSASWRGNRLPCDVDVALELMDNQEQLPLEWREVGIVFPGTIADVWLGLLMRPTCHKQVPIIWYDELTEGWVLDEHVWLDDHWDPEEFRVAVELPYRSKTSTRRG